jgi:hypothetical protein
MEVVSANGGLLTNCEVKELLAHRRQRRQHDEPQQQAAPELQNRERVEIQVLKYIDESVPSVTNTPELVRECLSALKKMDLGFTEGELVQVANHVPMRQVELHLVVEECAERMTEEQSGEVIHVVTKVYEKAMKPS